MYIYNFIRIIFWEDVLLLNETKNDHHKIMQIIVKGLKVHNITPFA